MLQTQGAGFKTHTQSIDVNSPMLLGKRGSNPHRLNSDMPDDLLNPMEISNPSATLRPKSRGAQKDPRRNSSTFSCYYLNQKAKDLASLMTIEDRKGKDTILEHDFDAD